jgi:hypothetical protein
VKDDEAEGVSLMRMANFSSSREWLKRLALVVALSVPFEQFGSPRAIAQELPCMTCRAMHPFRTCKKSFGGKPLLNMRVSGMSSDRCGYQTLKLNPENAAANNLPEEIEMAFGPCDFFGGKVGDTIQMALREEAHPTTRVYTSACDPYAR